MEGEGISEGVTKQRCREMDAFHLVPLMSYDFYYINSTLPFITI